MSRRNEELISRGASIPIRCIARTAPFASS